MPRGTSISDYGQGPWRFIGRVPSHGYRWEDGDDGPCLVDAETGGQYGQVMMDYQQTLKRPVHRAIWQVYKAHKTGDTALQDAVFELASSYGNLCSPKSFYCVPTKEGDVYRSNPGVSLAQWVDTIRDVGRLTELWDALRQRDIARLGKMVTWHPTRATADGVAITWRDGWGGNMGPVIARRSVPRPDLLEELLRLDGAEAVATVVRFGLADELNRQLKDGVAVSLFPTLGKGAKALAGLHNDLGEAVVHVGNEPVGPHGLLGGLVPRDLRMVAFLQLHSEIAGIRTYNQCAAPNCGVWFEPETRSHQRYCGEACAKRAQRARTRASAASSGDGA